MKHLFNQSTVEFSFGLGNQLFQFVFMLYLREKQGKSVKFDTSFYKAHRAHEGFQANLVFDFSGFKKSKINHDFLHKVCRKMKLRKLANRLWGNEDNFSHGFNYPFYNGYWQNASYYNEIKEILKQYELDLTPYANKTFLGRVTAQKSLFMHIRRGDYLSNDNYVDLCSTDYYKKAIELAKERFDAVNVFVFSDDVEWCRKYFSEYENFNFVEYENQTAISDLALMSCCDCGIIANSTFSWWGAMLNKDKLVIRPGKYYNDTQWASNFDNLFPSSWMTIDV